MVRSNSSSSISATYKSEEVNVYGNSIHTSQEFLTLSQAAKTLPRINGRKINTSTIFRWCKRGVRGVYLAYYKIGRNIVVTESSLQTFFAALAQADKTGQTSSTVTRKRRPRRTISAARQRAIQDANEVLLRAGLLKTADVRQLASVQDGGLR